MKKSRNKRCYNGSMKVTVFGANKADIEPLVVSMGFDIVDSNPDFVITYGGDGTLVRSEEAFPGIPKIALRDSAVCKKCSRVSNEEVLTAIKNNAYKTEQLMKMSATAQGKTIIGMNDIIVHNADPRRGIRYTLAVNDTVINQQIIGDGVVIATPFGSTGYYRSITDSYFEIGIGIAFNNSTEQADHIVIKEDSTVQFILTRGPAIVYADNKDENIELVEGDVVEIRKAGTTATIVTLNT